MAQWKEINPTELSKNPFSLIGQEWMLITAGDQKKANTMTASWGGVGILWNKPVAFCFIRPQRYTLEFVEREDYYTLSFFGPEYRKALNYCGSHSGRDGDKFAACGLTPSYDLAPYPEEANLVLVCKKLYKQDMEKDCFLDPALVEKNYPAGDFHRTFVGEIVKVLVKE
jgi:flavin reductase (DIM6/NTAB) family NADH-FMN oxidoreductase RutF